MISTEHMRALENASGIPKSVLMERAGRGAAETIRQRFDINDKSILIVAYHGNNGGDGLVAAHHLAEHAEVDVLFLGDESKLSHESKHAYNRIGNDPRIQVLGIEALDFSDYDIIVDAIFGTGFLGEIKDPITGIITNLSKSKGTKVSIDVPSGINPSTGEKKEAYFEPDLVIAMHDLKEGLRAYQDKTVVIDLGLPKKEDS